MNPYKGVEESSSTAVPHLTYEDIASKLLKDHYLLTALELHTELVESGKELPQLREFFSNPGNFEQHVSRGMETGSMKRTPSQATLDSLDTARYSEDGGGDRGGSGGDVAVLEFELRKARETINSLRANLTQFADEDSALEKSSKDNCDQRSLKPHEKRALNFLINEYLLLQDYKLTSITFSDENPDQDFEDWDDVGLIMPRPSGLVSLFRGNSGLNAPGCDASTATDRGTGDLACQTDGVGGDVCSGCQSNLDGETDWNQELLIQAEEIAILKQKIVALETEKLNFQKLYDAAIVSLNSLTSPASDSKGLVLSIPADRLRTMHGVKVEESLTIQPLPCNATENHYGSEHSTHSVTPEQFEMIESDKSGMAKKESSNASPFEPATPVEASRRASPRRGSAATLDETLSLHDGGDWTPLQYDCAGLENKEMWIDSGLPNDLKVSILNWCCETLNINEPLANDLLADLVNSEKPIEITGLVTLVADTLPRIIPHTLVSRRCEAGALLAAAVHLLSGDASPRRARLLQLLLTLLKKPDAAETRIVCEAACLIVKWGGSGEVLSSIAELLTSRSSERRVLASQICVSIAPYVSIELCTSLLLSLVVLMCESNENEVRSLGLKAACLVTPVAENKYGQLESLMFGFLKDPVEKNVKDTVHIFVPLLARTALIAGKFSSDLCNRILTNLSKASTDKDWRQMLLYLDILRVLVLAELAYVVNVQIVKDTTFNNCDMMINYEVTLESDQESFLDIQCYICDAGADVKSLLVAMNSLIREKPDVRWTELNWFLNSAQQILEIASNCKSQNQPNVYGSLITLFSSYADHFGVHFTTHMLRPIFMEVISDLERKMEKLHAVNVDSTVAVGIYLAAILPILEDKRELESFLQKWILYSAIWAFPVKVFAVPLQWVSRNRPDSLNNYLQCAREFAASSGESPNGSRIRVYTANLVAELLNTADVASDTIETQILPAVGALLNDGDVAVREAGVAAWGGAARAGLPRGGTVAARYWAVLEPLLASDVTAREAARAAEALALLVVPDAESGRGVADAAVSDKAVSLLCALCHRAPLTSESLSALAPGLQLVAHHARAHPDLLPALRKLEESVQTAALAQYRPAIEALVHNIAGPPSGPDVTSRDAQKPATSLLAAQEAVGRRVTQIFQQSKTNMNLPNIFKKKT